jgi:hypothetical protein
MNAPRERDHRMAFDALPSRQKRMVRSMYKTGVTIEDWKVKAKALWITQMKNS